MTPCALPRRLIVIPFQRQKELDKIEQINHSGSIIIQSKTTTYGLLKGHACGLRELENWMNKIFVQLSKESSEKASER